MLKSYQSIYVRSYRWIFRNFGQGKLPQFKSYFNVSFLLIIMLTVMLLLTQFLVKSQLFTIGSGTKLAIVMGAVFFMLCNYVVLLNNKRLKKLNDNLAFLNRHNHNSWSVVVLVNVIIICSFMLFTVA